AAGALHLEWAADAALRRPRATRLGESAVRHRGRGDRGSPLSAAAARDRLPVAGTLLRALLRTLPVDDRDSGLRDGDVAPTVRGGPAGIPRRRLAPRSVARGVGRGGVHGTVVPLRVALLWQPDPEQYTR